MTWLARAEGKTGRARLRDRFAPSCVLSLRSRRSQNATPLSRRRLTGRFRANLKRLTGGAGQSRAICASSIVSRRTRKVSTGVKRRAWLRALNRQGSSDARCSGDIWARRESLMTCSYLATTTPIPHASFTRQDCPDPCPTQPREIGGRSPFRFIAPIR